MFDEKKLVLVGGGGHCRAVFDSALASLKFDEIVVTDESYQEHIKDNMLNVIGGDNMLPILYKQGYRLAVITVGSIKTTTLRRQLAEYVKGLGFSFATIIDPTAAVSNYTSIGHGCFLGKNSVLNANVKVGAHVIINSGAIVEHDCVIGDYSHVSVGTVICGGCQISNDVFLGANATVIQGVKIGMNSVIGAGSIVLNDVPENTTVYGLWGGYKQTNLITIPNQFVMGRCAA